MSSYTFVPPRHELPDEWAAQLRAAVIARHDICAVYWLTTLHETDAGTVAQDELHIELAEPPEHAAGAEQYREMSDVIPAGPERGGLVWAISPRRILADVRAAGVRVA